MPLSDSLAATAGHVNQDLFRSARNLVDPAWIEQALAEGPVVKVLRRKMPAEVVVWLVIGAGLFARMCFEEAVRYLDLTVPTRSGLKQEPPVSSAVAQARKRLGKDVMMRLFRIASTHWSEVPEVRSHWFGGLRVLAADGVLFRTQDTETNREAFGKPGTNDGQPAAFPQMRVECIVDTFSRLVLDAEWGSYAEGEIQLLERMIARLPASSILLLDRGYRSFALLHRIQQLGNDRYAMVRAWKGLKVKVIRNLGPRDDLVEAHPGWAVRQKDPTMPERIVLRRIQYSFRGKPGVLLTTLQDHRRFPAMELAALYRARWEVEQVFDEIKTEQRDAATTLRSKTSEGTVQELFGVLLAYNLVRVEMARAAAAARLPPYRISFHRSLALVCHFFEHVTKGTPATKMDDRASMLRSSLQFLVLPPRRPERQYPRVLKRVLRDYPRKRIVLPQGSA